jgi:hypothetical protein
MTRQDSPLNLGPDTWFSFRSLGRAGSHNVAPEVSIGNRKRPAFDEPVSFVPPWIDLC